MLNTKNLKFIDSYEKLKEGYLYLVKDATENFYEIILIEEKRDINFTRKSLSSSEDWEINSTINSEKDIISRVRETVKTFDNTYTYAFYETGPQEDHPEYLL
jgi:hypothetical protein